MPEWFINFLKGMKTKTRRNISIIAFILTLCVYVLMCPQIAMLWPDISLANKLQIRTNSGVMFGLFILIFVTLWFFVKAVFSKESALFWFAVAFLSVAFLWFRIDSEAFKKSAAEGGVTIRSAIVYEKASGRRSRYLRYYYFRNEEKRRGSQNVSKEGFSQVNVGDTILIMQPIDDDWLGRRIYKLNPTSEEKVKGLEGYEINIRKVEE